MTVGMVWGLKQHRVRIGGRKSLQRSRHEALQRTTARAVQRWLGDLGGRISALLPHSHSQFPLVNKRERQPAYHL